MNRRGFLTAAVAATTALAVAPTTALTVPGKAAAPALPDYVLNAMWGTYGKHAERHCGGTCPEHRLRWVRLVDCKTPHLLAILATQYQIAGTNYPHIIGLILMSRGFNPSQIKDAVEAARSV